MNYSKDGITVAPMLDTTHPKKSGRCPVKIRVTYNRVRYYYPTGKDLTPEEWEMLPTTKARALVAVRKDIESSYQIVRAAVEELAASGGFSLDTLNNRLKGAAVDTVNTMFRAKIEELKKVGRVGSMLVYDNVLKGLERFAGAHIRFEAVTVSWLGRYADFLRKEGKTQTTIAIHLRHLRAILNAAKRLGSIKDAQYPNRGIENVYFQEGIMWSIKKHYEYTKGKFSFADFIGITKMKFTGNNGSKEAFVGVGKDLLEDMMKVDYTLTKDINVKSREKWGIKFQAFESSFGTMNVVHLPILDEVGLSEIGICLDLDMLVLYKMEEERRNINMETQGEAAERNVTIQTDCLTLKGYSHLLIKPNTSGFNDAEPDLVKAKTNDGATLPSEGNKEGAILYLKKDVASTGTNDELKAGMLAQWNGTKWVKYDGDVYIGA